MRARVWVASVVASVLVLCISSALVAEQDDKLRVAEAEMTQVDTDLLSVVAKPWIAGLHSYAENVPGATPSVARLADEVESGLAIASGDTAKMKLFSQSLMVKMRDVDSGAVITGLDPAHKKCFANCLFCVRQLVDRMVTERETRHAELTSLSR